MDWASSTVPKQPNVVQQKRTICTSGRPLLQSASLFAAKASSDLLIGLSSNTRGDFVRWGPGDRKHSSHSCLRAAVIFGAFFFCCSRRRQPARWRGHLARASKFDGKWYINCTPPPHTGPIAESSSWPHNRPGRGLPAAKYARNRDVLRRGFGTMTPWCRWVWVSMDTRLFRTRGAQAGAPCSNPEVSMATSGDIF